MEYFLFRSKRLTVAITLNSQGNLIVRAPKDLPSEQLELILQQKANWIERTKTLIQKQQKFCYNPLSDHKLIFVWSNLFYPLYRNQSPNPDR